MLPNEINPLYGAFCEPLACTLHGMDIGAAREGETVLVIGGGVIGLMAVQLAKLVGAEVLLLTRSSEKQALGLNIGADYAVGTEDEVRNIWPEGADLVVECAGVSATVTLSPKLARSGGRVVILGVVSQGEKVPIEPFDLLFREIQMHFSFLNPFTHGRAAKMIADGTVNISPLISRTISLEEAATVIASPPPKGEVRAIVVPNQD